MDEVNQNLAPKKSKIKSAHTRSPPQKLPNPPPPRKKPIFFQTPFGNIQKIKGADAATPSENLIHKIMHLTLVMASFQIRLSKCQSV